MADTPPVEFPKPDAFDAFVTYRPTGESYGVGSGGGMTVCETRIMEGNNAAIEADPSAFWCELAFDLPVRLLLGPEQWTVPLEGIQLRVRLVVAKRGKELWSSLNTTTLPEFTRVTIKAVPAFRPVQTQRVAEIVLDNVDLLLSTTGQKTLAEAERQGLSLRANFFRRPDMTERVATTTVPLTGIIVRDVRDAIPLTPVVLERVRQLRDDAVEFIRSNAQAEPFAQRVVRTVHDFGFYCRQHPETLGLLKEEELRDLLLVVNKVLFQAEGEAIQHRGKTDLKVVNPDNRYEFAVEELKFWRGEPSISELLQQALSDHVTGQELLVVTQVFSRNKDFANVVAQVSTIMSNHVAIVSPLKPIVFEGSPETILRSVADIRGRAIPFFVSLVDIYSPQR